MDWRTAFIGRRNERWLLYASPILVGLSSLVGLNRMAAFFGVIWAANLWGSLAFFVGTMWAIRLTLRRRQQLRAGLSVYAIGLHGLVYAVSGMFSLHALFSDGGFRNFFLPIPNPQALGLIFTVGWPGLALQGLAALTLGLTAPMPIQPTSGEAKPIELKPDASVEETGHVRKKANSPSKQGPRGTKRAKRTTTSSPKKPRKGGVT